MTTAGATHDLSWSQLAKTAPESPKEPASAGSFSFILLAVTSLNQLGEFRVGYALSGPSGLCHPACPHVVLSAGGLNGTEDGRVEDERRARVVIADDSADIRTLIRMQLERDGRFQVLDEATDAYAAIELVREHRPDVATFDLHMSGMTDLALLGDIRQACPDTAIVIVTGTYHPARDPDLELADIDAWFTKDQIMGDFSDRLLELRQPEP